MLSCVISIADSISEGGSIISDGEEWPSLIRDAHKDMVLQEHRMHERQTSVYVRGGESGLISHVN